MVQKIKIYNQKGETVKEISVPKCLQIEYKSDLVSRYIDFLRSQKREAVANTKDRSEVSGGGRKPWRQKGTGNARAGSSRSPIWVGGGVTFGPTNERNYSKRMNSKERKQALMMLFADRLKSLMIIDKIEISEPKTKNALKILDKLPLQEGEITLFLSRDSQNSILAFRNLPFLNLMQAKNIDVLKIGEKNQLLFEESEFNSFVKIYDHDK
jgi:large subunit ribosomal protein L4